MEKGLVRILELLKHNKTGGGGAHFQYSGSWSLSFHRFDHINSSLSRILAALTEYIEQKLPADRDKIPEIKKITAEIEEEAQQFDEKYGQYCRENPVYFIVSKYTGLDQRTNWY